MTDTAIILVGIAVGLALSLLGIVTGYVLAIRAHRAGANMADRIRHDQVPYEGEEIETAPIETHTGGRTFEESGG